MKIDQIFVAGAGFMGSGIAQVALQAGYSVILYDLNEELAAKGKEKLADSLEKRVAKGKLEPSSAKEYISRLKATADLRDAGSAGLVIESVVEKAEVKKKLFQELDNVCPEEVIFCSNTSSISITDLSSVTVRPDKVIGLHFFSPAPVMKLVEVIKGLKTSRQTTDTIVELANKFGKEPVLVKDSPGFLVNRINNALRLEAYRCLEEGIASIEDIDKAMKLGLGHPMGPFELADFVGLDIGYSILETLWQNFREDRWAPPMMLKKLVIAGDLGRKTDRGWYEYASGEKKLRQDIDY